MFLVVHKGTNKEYGKYAAVYQVATLEEAAKLVDNGSPRQAGAGSLRDELSWGTKRTGRWDSADKQWAVFPAEPEEEDED